MWRGELGGSVPLKELGASKTRLKDETPQPLDSACAAITSYQTTESKATEDSFVCSICKKPSLSEHQPIVPKTATRTLLQTKLPPQSLLNLPMKNLEMMSSLFSMRMIQQLHHAALKPAVNASNLLSKNAKL
ncbi:hypothetical protein AALO_G00096020 [Alosa alosa]|uniref:Uncharacterized protein n=1 Tax=Alosa alosa TaxID=278164 RepID=A0AAV6GTR4_9TELE|nr:hypothetical protein AALO_G00096020 [Alosa alosa]